MNKERRKEISEVHEKIRQAQAILSEVAEELESIKSYEEEYYDNMPEGIQAGEKGDKAQEAIDNLASAFDTLGSINDEINEALESLSSAAE